MIELKFRSPLWLDNWQYKRRQKKRDKFQEIAINKMFKIAGHKIRYKDVIKVKDNWFTQYTMTTKQEDEWREWFIKAIIKLYDFTEKYAHREFAMFNLNYGLKINQ